MQDDKYDVLYHPKIDRELLKIAKYYNSIGGRNLANRMIDAIVGELNGLAFMPESYIRVNEKKNIRKKTIAKPPYIAYYSVDRTNKVVRVLLLVHGSKNQERITRQFLK